MLYNSEQQAGKVEAFQPQAVHLGKVTCTGGQKFAYIMVCIITFGIFALVQNIGKKNNLNKLQIKINESASNIDVQLQKRFDTLTKIVDAIGSQAKFNQEVYENISKFRSGIKDINGKQEAIGKIQSGLNLAFENYPTLGTDESVSRLITESSMIEKEIAAARRLYNADVTEFNSIIFNWPYCVRAAKLNYEGLNLFVAEEAKRADVSTKF